MAGWLVDHAVLTYREAVGLTVRAKRLRGLPVTKAAWRDGALAGGQVTVIVERLGAQRTVRWSEHEAALVPGLGGLSIDDTTRAVDAWKAHADADGPTPPAQPQVLFPSRVGERWRTDGDFDALDGDIIGTAIRLATSPAPSPPQRGPHPEQLDTGAGGRTLSGMPVGGPDTELVLCDAVLHRVVMAGSEILDYGRAIRTTPAPLWNAVAIRDQRCRFAGCDRPTTWCDAHHIRWFSDGGPTSISNLVLLCRRHHRRLHSPGWEAKLLPDGTFQVVDPHGRVRHSRPPPPATSRGHPTLLAG